MVVAVMVTFFFVWVDVELLWRYYSCALGYAQGLYSVIRFVNLGIGTDLTK